MMRMILPLLFMVGPAEAADKAPKAVRSLEKRVAKAASGPAKAAVVREMGPLRHPDLLDDLLYAGADPSREVRHAALIALAAYGPELDLPERDELYLHGLNDADPGVQGAAVSALEPRLAQPEAGPRLLARLPAILRSSPSWSSRRATAGLLERSPAPLSEEAAKALLDAARADKHPEVRRAAVSALGSRAVAGAGPLLSRLRNADPDEPVRLAAEDALRRMGGTATALIIAVLPFEGRGKADNGSLRALQDAFTAAISSSQVATVVERGAVSARLVELKFQDAHIDDGRALAVGKLLRAEQVVTGTLERQGDELRCLARRVDVATGQVWAAPEVRGLTHDEAALRASCAARLLGTF
jgi:HEAT repeat protein